jgi:2-iminobutanoate/2-iminopropanoate deaminase
VYVANKDDYDAFKRVRAEVLAPPFPASTAVEATLLIDGMLVEIDAVAARGAVRRTQ